MPTPDTAATPAGRPAWTLATPGVRRSPDGKLLAWYSGGHHYSWLANDGHNRTAEDVADWTPLVPAVSVPPVSPADTDGLRARIAAALEEMPSEFIAPDEFGAYEVDYEMAASIVLPLFEQAHGDLVVRAANLRAQRDEFERLYRAEARDHDGTNSALVKAESQVRAWKAMAEARGGSRDHYVEQLRLATEGLEEYRREVAELRAELASRSTPPQDAGLPDTAERLAALARDFRDRAEKTITKALEGEQVADECDSPAECHASTEHFTWKLAALQVEKLVTALSSPATDPVPATPDGPHRVNFVVAEWDERIAFATCRDCLARISGDRPDVWEWKRLHEGAEDARCTKVNGDGARCIKGRALPHWCVFDETEPVAPQAPAEPPVGDALCGQVHDGLTCVHPRQAGQNGCWGHYGPEEDPQAHYRCDARWHIAGQNPCPRCEPIPGRPLPAVPAVPEDTATPDDEYSDDLAATFLRSSAGECREMVPDGPESYMSCGADTVPGTDRCDDHRADTTRPADSPSTSTPKEA